MGQLIVQKKALQFSLNIIDVYKRLSQEKNEYVMSKQVLRSATSIGANLEEALGCQSTKEFTHKVSIAYREARETKYWLKLLHLMTPPDRKSSLGFERCRSYSILPNS